VKEDEMAFQKLDGNNNFSVNIIRIGLISKGNISGILETRGGASMTI
jgi:hypothetical protein